jgi:hypothetical protein
MRILLEPIQILYLPASVHKTSAPPVLVLFFTNNYYSCDIIKHGGMPMALDKEKLRAVVPLVLDDATTVVDAEQFIQWMEVFEASSCKEWLDETGYLLIQKVERALDGINN